jgi:ADP-sugar diphosphatase
MNESFNSSTKIKRWRETLEKAGCRVGEIEPLKILNKSNGELLFGLVKAEVKDPSGRKLLPIALIRGHASVIIPRVRNTETGEQKFVMVRQRRIGNGHDSLEFPAGMLDYSDDPLLIAIKELQEETGLEVSQEQLISLNEEPLYTTPGLCDEGIYYFACQLDLSGEEYTKLNGAYRGNPEEGEYVHVELWDPKKVLPEMSSLPAILAFYLFQDKFPN